jgi:hypothetical protein
VGLRVLTDERLIYSQEVTSSSLVSPTSFLATDFPHETRSWGGAFHILSGRNTELYWFLWPAATTLGVSYARDTL